MSITPQKQSSSPVSNGVFGDNLISTGIWKIDFENSLITFTSNIDSLGKMDNVFKIPAELKGNILYINAGLRNETPVKLGVDLGYTGEVIIMKQKFKAIDTSNNAATSKALLTSAAGSELTTKYILYNESLQIGSFGFASAICTNDLISTDLVGLAFFSRFKFIILDYLNKAIYLSGMK